MARRSSRITLRDVAREAGVSPSAASVALRGAGPTSAHIRVGEATRQAVVEAAQRLGYQPNGAALALTGRSQLVGVLLEPPPQPAHVHHYMLGLQRELHTRHYHTLLGTMDAERGALGGWLEEFERQCVAGVLIVVSAGPSGESLRTEGVGARGPDGPPVVSVGVESVPGSDASVRIDSPGMARVATAHLAGLGHRRFLLVGINDRRRLAGCHAALADAGLPRTAALSLEGVFPPDASLAVRQRLERQRGLPLRSGADWMYERGRWVVHQVYGQRSGTPSLEGGERLPTAIVANTDAHAVGALEGLRELGLRVPEDVAVVGCGNRLYGGHLPVPLTTVDANIPAATNRAAALLAELIELRRGGVSPEAAAREPDTVPPTLIVRRSCGAHLRAGGSEGESARDQFSGDRPEQLLAHVLADVSEGIA